MSYEREARFVRRAGERISPEIRFVIQTRHTLLDHKRNEEMIEPQFHQ
jgi:hypothetical protein